MSFSRNLLFGIFLVGAAAGSQAAADQQQHDPFQQQELTPAELEQRQKELVFDAQSDICTCTLFREDDIHQLEHCKDHANVYWDNCKRADAVAQCVADISGAARSGCGKAPNCGNYFCLQQAHDKGYIPLLTISPNGVYPTPMEIPF